MSVGQNSLAQNRGERWQELTQIALGYSLGPEKSSNLETYETMNRPIIKTFQKHPGNQNAEIAHNIQVILIATFDSNQFDVFETIEFGFW